MKRRLTWVAQLSAAIAITPLYLAQRVHATPNNDRHGGCSIASLKGTYALRRKGVNNVIGGTIAQIGINREDGDVRILFIRTTRSENGVIIDWFDQQAPGSYTVDPDCTGTFFNKSQNLVVLDGGMRYLLLSVAPGTIVTEEGTRLEVED
jgi:hypothetical protein